MSPELTAAIARLKEKGEALGIAKTVEQELEDDRAAIKADAIQRVMKRDGIAATRAEAIVETDADYFAHRAKQRASVVARYKSDAEYWAAKCEATQASLITPDVFNLEKENERIWKALDDARGYVDSLMVSLAERQAANADLVQANRELAEEIAEAHADRFSLIAEKDRLTRNESITLNLAPINAEATP